MSDLYSIESLWSLGVPLPSEDACIALINRCFPFYSNHTSIERGDDCAELSVTSPLALSTDSFINDVHFRTRYFTPAEVGSKALIRAISDLAAAGSRPLGFSLALILPQNIGIITLQGLLEGIAQSASLYSIELTGGDTTQGNSLALCLTVWGEAQTPKHPLFLRRKQAQVNDIIFSIGELGMAYAGFLLLEKQGRSAVKEYPSLCYAHLAPAPLLQEGLALARIALSAQPERIGLMDVSDGLMQDLPRLLGEFSAELDFDSATIHPDLVHFAKSYGYNVESLFLTGGEDYALLGTCTPSLWNDIQNKFHQVRRLGTVVPKKAHPIYRKNTPVTLQGFDHFQKTFPSTSKKHL